MSVATEKFFGLDKPSSDPARRDTRVREAAYDFAKLIQNIFDPSPKRKLALYAIKVAMVTCLALTED